MGKKVLGSPRERTDGGTRRRMKRQTDGKCSLFCWNWPTLSRETARIFASRATFKSYALQLHRVMLGQRFSFLSPFLFLFVLFSNVCSLSEHMSLLIGSYRPRRAHLPYASRMKCSFSLRAFRLSGTYQWILGYGRDCIRNVNPSATEHCFIILFVWTMQIYISREIAHKMLRCCRLWTMVLSSFGGYCTERCCIQFRIKRSDIQVLFEWATVSEIYSYGRVAF